MRSQEIDKGLEGMVIVQDSREQKPWVFGDRAALTVATLEAGDYSVLGMEDEVAIERKSLQDLVGTLTQGRERFMREMHKLNGYLFAAVIVESPISKLMKHEYISKVSPQSIIGSCIALQVRHGVAFHFCEGRAQAASLAFGFLRRYWLDTLAARSFRDAIQDAQAALGASGIQEPGSDTP